MSDQKYNEEAENALEEFRRMLREEAEQKIQQRVQHLTYGGSSTSSSSSSSSSAYGGRVYQSNLAMVGHRINANQFLLPPLYGPLPFYVHPSEIDIHSMLERDRTYQNRNGRQVLEYRLWIGQFNQRSLMHVFENMIESALQQIMAENNITEYDIMYIQFIYRNEFDDTISDDHEWHDRVDQGGIATRRRTMIQKLARRFWEFLFKTSEEYDGSELSSYIRIRCILYHNHYASPEGRRIFVDAFVRGKESRSIVQIRADGQCVFHAILMGMARNLSLTHRQEDQKSQWKRKYDTMRRLQPNGSSELTWLTFELAMASGVPVGKVEINSQMPKLQYALNQTLGNKYGFKNMVIKLVDEDNGETISSYGKAESEEECIYLRLHSQGHVDLITSIQGYKSNGRGNQGYCVKCDETFDIRTRHTMCEADRCKFCYRSHTSNGSRLATRSACTKCGRRFYYDACRDHHREECNFKICSECNQSYYAGRSAPDPPHRCYKFYCRQCQDFYPVRKDHICYWKNKPVEDKKIQWAVFDLETYQHKDDRLELTVGWLKWGPSEADELEFTTMQQFLSIIMGPRFKGYRFISHNGAGFDHWMVMSEMIDRNKLPQIMKNAGRLMRMQLFGRVFTDSRLHLSGSLDDIAKAFGLSYGKGFFPHQLSSYKNTTEVFEGCMPPLEVFEINRMKNSRRNDCVRFWYKEDAIYREEKKNYVWRKEQSEYCRVDTRLLYDIWTLYDVQMVKLFNIKPTPFITLPQLSIAALKAGFLKEDLVAIITSQGVGTLMQVGIDWVRYVSSITETNIRHALTSGSGYNPSVVASGKLIPVTGIHDATKTVYLCYGCYAHGCPECYALASHRKKVDNRLRGTTVCDRYYDTLETEVYLREAGYTVVSIWLCKLNRLRSIQHLEDETSLKEWQDITHFPLSITPRAWPDWYSSIQHDDFKVMNLRDAVAGGIVYVGWCTKTLSPGSYISFHDVVAMYIWVMISKDMPVGLPTSLRTIQPDQYMERMSTPHAYYGFIRAIILPPQTEDVPVLWTKWDLKLMFPLCRSCMEYATSHYPGGVPIVNLSDYVNCTHSEFERAMTGTWHTREVDEAVKIGYRILRIFEIIHFKTRSKEVFKAFINHTFRARIYGGGYRTEEERDQMIAAYQQEYPDLKLDAKDWPKEKNPAMKEVGKRSGNSVYGKTLQGRTHDDYRFVKDITDHRTMMRDVGVSRDVKIAKSFKHCDLMKITTKEEFDESSTFAVNEITNEWLGATITTEARLRWIDDARKLGRAADGSGKRCLYGDTDSHGVYNSPGDQVMPHSEILGHNKTEVPRIGELVVVGPKIYGYREEGVFEEYYDEASKEFKQRPKITIKAKGFTQTFNTDQQLSLDKLRQLAQGVPGRVAIEYLNAYQTEGIRLHMRMSEKILSQSFTKGNLVRHPNGDIEAVPFGYVYKR